MGTMTLWDRIRPWLRHPFSTPAAAIAFRYVESHPDLEIRFRAHVTSEEHRMKSPYISPYPDNDSALVVDIHADGIRVYVDRKFSPDDCRRLAQTLTDAAEAVESLMEAM